tara:strand:- start:12939 stop:14240 length:1302 start_codon:yes stop_codon:yes gene_type:complete
MNNLNQERVAVVIISGSAGELDWVLPILDYLLQNKFEIKVIFLSRHALKSVQENNMCNEFITQKTNKIEVIFIGGYFFEKIERIGYLTYRGFLKLEFSKIPLIKSLFKFYFLFLRFLFIKKLPSEITHFKDNKLIFFNEFPSLRRPRDKWIKQIFNKSLFFYCPHSPHIYTSDLDKKYLEPDNIDFNKKYFLLLGHPTDYSEIGLENEMSSPDLEKVFIGHPKYSKQWLNNRKNESEAFRSSFVKRKKANILVVSRGHGSYINEDAQKYYIEATCQVIHEQVKNYNLFVKKHPREKHSYWDKILEYYPSIKIVEDHVLDIATKVDFAITFWSSAAMECANLGVPVVEFYDPNKHSKQQIFEGDSFTTIYRKLGLVYAANDKKKLIEVVAGLLKKDHSMQLDRAHHFYNDLMNRSNLWEEKIEEILFKNDLIKS